MIANQKGAGRKPLPAELKRVAITIKLPPKLVEWLKNQPISQAKTIELALDQYRLSDSGK